MNDAFVSAIVLAAGKSSRMGTLKQLVPFKGKILLQRTIDSVHESTVQEIVLVLGYQADEIRKQTSLDQSIRVSINALYEQGMSTSIRTGLSNISAAASAALIVLADQPFLSPAVIDSLIREYEKTHAAIVVPVYKGFRGNPILIDRSLFPEMMQLQGDIGCRSLFGVHAGRIHTFNVDDPGILADLDTYADLQRWESVSNKSLADQFTKGDLENRAVLQADDRQIIIIGSDEVAKSLAKLAKVLKFRVTVIDPFLTMDQVPGADQIVKELDLSLVDVKKDTSIVVASRGKFDEDALRQSIPTAAGYIALVGSKKRGAEILKRLLDHGINQDAARRIRCPAGIEIHADTAEEIALSILAEIVAMQRSGN